MKRLAVLLLLAAPLMAQHSVKWETRLADAQRRARAEKKLIFVDVWTEWCIWCVRLQKNVFPTPEGQAALAGVVPLSLKTQLMDGTPTENKSMEQRFKVQGFPALFVIDADGRVLREHGGYLEPQAFRAFVEGR